MALLNPHKFKAWRYLWLVTLLAFFGACQVSPPPGLIVKVATFSQPLGSPGSQQAPEEEELNHHHSTACDVSLGRKLRAMRLLIHGYMPRRVDTTPLALLPSVRADRSALPTRETDLPPTGLRAPPARA